MVKETPKENFKKGHHGRTMEAGDLVRKAPKGPAAKNKVSGDVKVKKAPKERDQSSPTARTGYLGRVP